MTNRFKTMSVLVLAGTLTAAGLALAGCSGPGDDVDLGGRAFTATEVRGHKIVDGSSIVVTFEEGNVSVNAGCNTQFGPVKWDEQKLEVDGVLASTMMACDEALMAQDQWLAEFLMSTPALALDGDTLTLGDDTTGMTLVEE
ncbi:MAG TPA: META domain-containing protein [Actinomycetaceae bacterium]|nr:META domain-containing protein [Actinomycetaceae bacterium]